MDIEFELQGIRFVANREKARRNPAKHQGVTFEQAAQAFFDPFLKVVDADRNEEARDADRHGCRVAAAVRCPYPAGG